MKAIVISIDGFAGFYWDDPVVRLPTLRRLAERGVVASRMETVYPSTTWPTHVSLMTGVSPARHGVVGNYILNRGSGQPEDLSGDPVYDAPHLLRAPTVYDLAHAAGRRTAPVALWIRQQSAGRTRLVQLGRNGADFADLFDLAVTPGYCRLFPHPNRIETSATLHAVSQPAPAASHAAWVYDIGVRLPAGVQTPG